ncbi:MAG: phosphodiesterase [Xylophilus ampelinus]
MDTPAAPIAIAELDAEAGEELLALWADLETGLATVLASPSGIADFGGKVVQYRRWLHALLLQDMDLSLYLLMQLATASRAGYSASHALVCAALCHIVAEALDLPAAERDALGHAALTMNLAMTAVQDRLALQASPPTPEQRDVIDRHAEQGARLLEQLGVRDPVWCETVRLHHTPPARKTALLAMPVAARLGHVLRTVDRYAAMVSPRASRPGRSVLESARTILGGHRYQDEVGFALVRSVGLCPPGNFVELDNGEIAVVVRRSATPNKPVVAVLRLRDGSLPQQLRLHRLEEGPPQVRQVLSRHQVAVPVQQRSLLLVALEAARRLATRTEAAG